MGVKHHLKSGLSAIAATAGLRLVRAGEAVVPPGMRLVGETEGVAPPGMRLVPDHVAINGHKLIDLRQEREFGALAEKVLAEGRTTMTHDRLYVLWQAVGNIGHREGDIAEVGTYRGGSARFLALTLQQRGRYCPLHVFDTFEGHPNVIVPDLDGPHSVGLFSDTSYEAVRDYLAPHPNIVLHRGAFQDTCSEVGEKRFALAHVDVDLYASTVSCLEFFWPRMIEGGVIALDDYGFSTCHGLKVAVDRFTAEVGCPVWYMHTGQLVITKGSP
jgi:O-methyltransferase